MHSCYNDGAVISAALVRAYLTDRLLTPASPIQLVVAMQGGSSHVVGMASISLTFLLVEPAPDRRRQCWLKELYVATSARSARVGRALMAWVSAYAVEQGCCRIDRPVKASNARGITFCESLGAEQVIERLSYRSSEPQLSVLADTDAHP